MRKKFLLMLTLLILALGGGGNLFAQTQVTDFNSLVSAIQNGETTIEVNADITTESDLVVPAGVTINVNASLNVLNTITNNGTINVRTKVYVVEEVQPYFGFSYNKTATMNGSITGNVPSSINYQISLDGGNTWFKDTTDGKAQAVTVKTDGTTSISTSFQSAFTSAKTDEIVHMLKDAHVQSTNPKKNNGPLRSYYGLILEGNGHTIFTDLESSGASNEYATIKFTSYLAGTGPEVNPILKNVTINSQNNAKADLDYVSGDVTFTVTMYNVNLLGNCQMASMTWKSNSMIINKSNVEIFDCNIPSWDAGSAKAIDFYSGEYSLKLNNKCTVYGGTFTTDVSNYLADGVEMEEVNGKYVVSRSYVAQIDDNKYYSLDEAFAEATEGQTITLLADATPALTSQRAITKAAVIDLNGKTLTLTEDDLYFGTTTFQNGKIKVDLSVNVSTAVFWMFANQTLTFDNVKVVATGVTGTYLIGLDGNNSDLNLLNGSEILVENTTALDLDIICVNASTGNDIKVENSKVNVTNLDGRVFFRGNYTVKDSEVNLAGITKAGFRIEAGQTLSIEGTSKVNIEGEPRDGGIHLTDFTATYTKAETATVNATINRPYAAQIGDFKYITFAEAVADAEAGNEIIMLSDVTLDAETTLPAGIIFNGNGKQINGTIYAGGDLTFAGHTKVTAFSASYYNRIINIGEDACLEITGTGRVTLGYGNTFNITGSVENAKTADKANVQASLIIPGGISITGGNNAAMNVTNAYVKIGSTTSKNSAANGTFTMNFTNSIAEFTNQLTFAEPTSGMNPTFNLNITNSILTTGTKLIAAAPKSNIVVDNSNVTLATYFRNSGTFNVKNGSVLTGATIQFGENGGNNGELIVDASTFTITASSVGHALDGKSTGKIVLKNAAIANIDYIKDMDELYMTKDSKLYSKTSGLNIQTEPTYKVVYNNEVYEAVDATIYVETKAELKSAIEGAEDGTFIKMTANIDYGADQLAITKAITLDLGGKTLTTQNAYGGMSVKGNPTIKNGIIVHASNTAAIKVWNATAFEDLVIDVQGKGDANKTIGGIVLQSGSTTRVGSIKNVTIEGAALTNGIETYNCGDATENVIGSMENVTIDAVGTGMLISAPCGTATNCDIKGGVNGIEIWIKGTYSASLDLVNSIVEGGVYAHDEFSNNPDVVNNGILKLTADGETTGADVDDVTLTIARAKAENVQGEIFEYIMENAVAKGNNTFYATLQEAIIAAAPDGTVDILANVTVDEWIMIATNLTMGDGTIITLDINGMTINGNNHTITIKDIESAGNGGYLFYDAAELNIKDLTISYAAGLTGGICLKKGTIEKVTFNGGKYGVLPGANGVTIKECTFNGTTSYAVYYEDAREGIVVTGNKFNTAEGAYAIIMRSNEEFKNNTIEKGRVNIANSSSATVTGNDFGEERFKVYNGAEATIENNKINNLEFNDPAAVVNSTFTDNELSDEAAALLNSTAFEGGTWGGIDWTLTNDGVLTIAPTTGTPVADKNYPARTYEVGAWREAVRYNSKGDGVAIEGWPYDRSKVKTLVIKEGVISIGSFAAQSFTNLTGEVVIPSTVKYIGQEAFQKSTMTKLTFAAGGSEELCIAQGAFKNLIIEEVSLPEDRLVHLHAWVFNNCHNLKHATMPATVVSVHGTNHIDYFKDFNAHSNPTWTKSSEIFAYNENMETVTFGSEEVRDLFYSYDNNTSDKDYIVATVGLTSYCKIADAIAAVNENGGTIKLHGNAILADTWTIPAGKEVTLNLNGKTISQEKACTASYSMINNKGNLTIKGEGKLSFKDTGAGDPNFGWGSYTVRNEGNLVVENATIEHKGAQEFAKHMICAIFQYSGSTTINGGTISTPNYRSARLWKGDMTINGGTFDGQLWVQAVDNSAKLTINGGTFEPNGQDASAVFVTNADHDAKLAVTNGTFKGKVGCSDATKLAGTITGGMFTETAKNGTNSTLLATGLTFGEADANGYYTVQDDPTTHYINNVEELKAFRNEVNSGNTYAGVTVYLAADIDLEEEDWTPITKFNGTFDGQDYTISNLWVTGSGNCGFFKQVADQTEHVTGTVKNVNFENATIISQSGNGTAGIIADARLGARINNVNLTGEVTIQGYRGVGGIVGAGFPVIEGCTVEAEGSITATYWGAGGILGFASDKGAKAINSTVKGIDEGLTIHGEYGGVGSVTGTPYGAAVDGATINDVNITSNNDYYMAYVDASGEVKNANVDNVVVKVNGNVIVGCDAVATIGTKPYFTFADAVAAAENNATINLIWKEGKAPIAMNASLYGKSVTITGTATVDWSKGFLFVGRGGEGDATLTFDNANLTSASNNASTGIHVSGREKNTDNKYDGIVVINNSTIELDYLINKGVMTMDNSTLTVKNGFSIGGRPASETESGADATATITLNNGSKVVVNNHNGMGLGYEAIGVMNINGGSTFECTQDFLVTAKGTMNVNGGIVTTEVKITNKGTMNVSGESTLNIASLAENEINFLDGAIINNSTIGGDVFVAGYVTFRGDNTFNMLYDYGTLTDYYGTTAPMKWNVKEGASLTLTEKARYGLGYGDNVTIIGSIDNALTARENLTEADRSLFMHGLVAQESKGWNCESALNIENAYVVIGSNNSFGNKPGNYGGDYTFNIKNSVVDASRITFYEALSTSTFTFEGSDVKMGTFMTNDKDSKFTLKDSKVLSTTTTNGNDEGNYNAGELTLVNSSLTYSATLTNKDKATIKLDAKSKLTAPAISGAGTITIDAANFVIGGGDVQVVYATINVDANNINVVNNNYVTAVITETGIVIKENNLEGEGTETNPYIVSSLTELELFRNKVNAGDNYAGEYVKLTADVDLSATRSANNWEPIGTTDNPFMGTFDGADYTISNLVVEGESNVGLFGYANKATIKNVIISNANVKGTDCVGAIAGQVYSESLIDNCHVNGNIKVEGQTNVGGIVGKYYTKVSNCSVIGDDVATSYVKGTYVASDFEGDNIGGIMGHCGEDNTLTANTVKNITISGTRKVGGIVGVADQNTDVKDCVVENVNIKTTATVEYAEANKAKAGHGALVGSYQIAGSTNDGTVSACIVKNVNFINENNNVIFSAGPITGGARGGSDGMLAPTGVTASNNDIYMSTITGSNNLYLMNAVAEIDGVYYYTLQDAFNAGGEVVVLRDITLTETATIAAGKEVVLNLNGHTIKQVKECTASYEMISNKGKLTIKGNGNISFKDTSAGDPTFGWGSYTLRNEGTLVVENGTIEHLGEQNPGNGQPNRHMYCAIFQYSGSSTIKGGTISTPTYRSARLWSGDMTINGGNFVGQLWLQAVNNTSDLTINGGTFTAKGNDGSSVFVSNSTHDVAFAVTGGTFNHKIGASDVNKQGVKGSISGGLFSQAAKENTAAELIDARFKFENMPNIDGYYSIIQFAGTQTREFASAGWYWFSTYIDLEGTDGLDTLQEALGENAKQIKGQEGFTQYYSAYQAWSPGGLTAISTAKMYMINTTDPVTVELTGDFVDYEDRDITLNPGWNWIGYPVRDTVDVKDALANLIPSNGDAIKSKDWTMTYIMGQWLGSREMTPGMGYMYKSNAGSVKTFRYSTNVTNNSRSENTVEEYHWIADATKYPSNMTVIAMLNIDGEVASDNYEVAAFANGECRGSARPFYVEAIDSYILIMTIQGEEVEELTFKCYDVNYDTEYELSNRFNYSSDAILGSFEEPYMFNMNFLNIEESTLDMINIYPNPTTTDRAINLQATCDNVEVFNALGVKVAEYQNVDTIDALETAGVYVIRVTINGEVKNCRLVVE